MGVANHDRSETQMITSRKPTETTDYAGQVAVVRFALNTEVSQGENAALIYLYPCSPIAANCAILMFSQGQGPGKVA